MTRYYLTDRETDEALDRNGETASSGTGGPVEYYDTLDEATDALDDIEYARVRQLDTPTNGGQP